MKLRMLPEAEQKYLMQLRTASDDTIGIARLLQAAAFGGTIPQIPAPVYMRQATWFVEHGYKIVGLNDEQAREER